MPQLILNFNDIPIPEAHLWEQFDDEQKRIVIETLPRLLFQATRDQRQERQEPTNDSSLQNQTYSHPTRRLRLHSPVHAGPGRA